MACELSLFSVSGLVLVRAGADFLEHPHRTPCTVRAGFVSAVLAAGFHIELAGGGHYNAKALRNKVDEIQQLVNKPGVGVTLNSLYINQRQWCVSPFSCRRRRRL